MHSIPAKLALLVSLSLCGLVSGRVVDGPPPAPLDDSVFKNFIPLNEVNTTDSANMTEIDPLADTPPFQGIVQASWIRNATLVAEYYEDGTVYRVVRNEEKLRMNVIKLCGSGFEAPNIYWKGGITGAHVHQDNKRNQKQFYAGVTQGENDTIGGFVARDRPVEIMTDRTSTACGVVAPSWTTKGVWGQLGLIINHFLTIWFAPKDTCSLGTSGPGDKGLRCFLPCEPISPMWLESTDKYARQNKYVNGKQLYSALYKIRAQFNKGDGNGGLGPSEWLTAQCSGDDLTTQQNPNLASLVAFW